MIEEIGIDRWQMNVTGHWRTPDRVGVYSPQEVVELLTTPPLEVDWFRNPERTSKGMKLCSRSRAGSTLGEIEFRVERREGRQGGLSAWLKNANATRTLAHLLADHAGSSDFLHTIRNLGPFDFFRQASRAIPKSFGGGGDNWLPDPDLVLHNLGPDPFGAFLPVYVDQLQRLIVTVLSPSILATYGTEGAGVIAFDADVACRWDWADVRVPQIECYFERHHARALGAVRGAATAALASLDRVDARRYDAMESDFIERSGDCLSIGTNLNDRYRLKVYAKSRSRIRFEVMRNGKGDYGGLARPVRPSDRLLSILQMERENAVTAARWPNVGQLFDEHPLPQTDDVARLFSRIAEACAVHQVQMEPVMARLLEDGGGCLNGDGALPNALLLDLCRRGVLARHVVRRQDHRLPEKRYALTPAYRHLVQTIRAVLAADLER